jgi:hypothetical protein
MTEEPNNVFQEPPSLVGRTETHYPGGGPPERPITALRPSCVRRRPHIQCGEIPPKSKAGSPPRADSLVEPFARELRPRIFSPVNRHRRAVPVIGAARPLL